MDLLPPPHQHKSIYPPPRQTNTHHDTHSPHIQHPLHEPGATLVRHPHERGDARRQARDAQLGGVAQRQRRVLQVDEQAVVAGRGGDQDDRHVGRELDAECLPLGGE